MFEITRLSARSCSLLGQRGSIFGQAVLDAAQEDEKFILLTADLATLSGMSKYLETYPNQFYNIGIAEQNMIGISAGLAAVPQSKVCGDRSEFFLWCQGKGQSQDAGACRGGLRFSGRNRAGGAAGRQDGQQYQDTRFD